MVQMGPWVLRERLVRVAGWAPWVRSVRQARADLPALMVQLAQEGRWVQPG